MRRTERELNRATLARQILLERGSLNVTDAVRRVVALQSQQPASPYIALWNRLAGFDPAELDAAFADHRVVRAQLMRITMHAVHKEDHQAFREAMEPTLRASRLRAWLARQLGTPKPPLACRLLRQYAPLWHVPTDGPWSFGTRAYVVARPRPVLADPDVSGLALRTLVRRYLGASARRRSRTWPGSRWSSGPGSRRRCRRSAVSFPNGKDRTARYSTTCPAPRSPPGTPRRRRG